MYLTWAIAVFLAFFPFSRINNFWRLNVVAGSIPTRASIKSPIKMRLFEGLCQDCASTQFERAAKADAFQGNGLLQQVSGERIAEEVWVPVRNLGGFEYLGDPLAPDRRSCRHLRIAGPEVEPACRRLVAKLTADRRRITSRVRVPRPSP